MAHEKVLWWLDKGIIAGLCVMGIGLLLKIVVGSYHVVGLLQGW